MSGVVFGLSLLGCAGLSLLLSEVRWFQRVGLVERLRAHAGGAQRLRSPDVLSAESFKEVIAPLSRSVGERLARLFRVSEELEARLERVHSPIGVTGFRVRQVGWAAAALGAAVVLSVALRLNALLAMGLVFGSPLLAFLLLEQRAAAESARWQNRLRAELPVIAEQIGMLLSAGWSLGAALARVGERGAGICAEDLRRVAARIRQGLSEIDALREWARRADVDSLFRLVSVLSLNREAADFGGLISEEARTMRRESHRELIESIEKRTQQVWIPVTAATLVPGVMLMGVPFVDALTLFA